MSNPNPPNKFKKGEPRPAGAGRRPGAVNHLTTARVKTERKVRVVYQTVDEARAALRAKGIDPGDRVRDDAKVSAAEAVANWHRCLAAKRLM
jgi:hypothetical protein